MWVKPTLAKSFSILLIDVKTISIFCIGSFDVSDNEKGSNLLMSN
jgi:hypothetical protein